MKLIFKTLGGVQLSCSGIADDTTIHQIKLLMCADYDICPPPENMQLIYCGQLLQDTDTVLEKHILQDSVLHLIDLRPGFNGLNRNELNLKIEEIKRKQTQEQEQEKRDAKAERDRRNHENRAKNELAKLRKIIEENSVSNEKSLGLLTAFLGSLLIPVAGPIIATGIAGGSAVNWAKNSYYCDKALVEKGIDIELAKEAMTPYELEKFEGRNKRSSMDIPTGLSSLGDFSPS